MANIPVEPGWYQYRHNIICYVEKNIPPINPRYMALKSTFRQIRGSKYARQWHYGVYGFDPTRLTPTTPTKYMLLDYMKWLTRGGQNVE